MKNESNTRPEKPSSKPDDNKKAASTIAPVKDDGSKSNKEAQTKINADRKSGAV